MIEITIKRKPDRMVSSVKSQGHSEKSNKGADTICAAVSVLLENLEASILLILKKKIGVQKKDGYHLIQIKKNSPEVQLLAESTILGLRSLQKKYPEYIGIIESS